MVSEFINDLQSILTNPYSLLFLSLFALGYLIKEKTKFSNKLIPVVLILAGVALAIFLLDFSLSSILVGAVLATLIMGYYETIRNTLQWYFSGGKQLISNVFNRGGDQPQPDDEE